MEYADWDEGNSKAIPLPEDDFDQYFTGYNEIDNLFNETLAGLLDLDVPSGFAPQNEKHLQQFQSSSSDSSSPHHRKHSRKISGTAIFGFTDHGKSLSINGGIPPSDNNDLNTADLGYKLSKKPEPVNASVSPDQLLKHQHQISISTRPIDFELPQHPLEDEEEEEAEANIGLEAASLKKTAGQEKSEEDFIVTNESPKSYKFPPSPLESKQPIMNSFTAKYLQEFNLTNVKVEYVDDIEPLLDEEIPTQFEAQSSPFNNQKVVSNNILGNANASNHQQGYKFVPIPVQDPKIVASNTQLNSKNAFLPPPSPPTLSNGSPEWSSPEPQSPSPSRMYNHQNSSDRGVSAVPYNNNPNFSSPIHPQQSKNFYTPQFFSDNNPVGYENTNNLAYQHLTPQNQSPVRPQQQQQQQQRFQQPYNLQALQEQAAAPPPASAHQIHYSPHYAHLNHHIPSSPVVNASLNSSPVRYYNSPLRNVANSGEPSNDDSIVDVNATIVQLTPLKENQFQTTPNRNSKLDLKWSPVISPNAKSSRDVRRAIQQFTPKRKIEKTSLLPPGELDQYWEGPDENKVFTCTFNGCGKKFTRRYNVRSHIQTHLSDRPFACAYCPKKFVRQHDLNRHVKGHQEARYCKCPCGKEFARLDAMRKHRARNICIGGVASNENHCIVKPKRKNSQILMDEFTSDMLSEELTTLGR